MASEPPQLTWVETFPDNEARFNYAAFILRPEGGEDEAAALYGYIARHPEVLIQTHLALHELDLMGRLDTTKTAPIYALALNSNWLLTPAEDILELLCEIDRTNFVVPKANFLIPWLLELVLKHPSISYEERLSALDAIEGLGSALLANDVELVISPDTASELLRSTVEKYRIQDPYLYAAMQCFIQQRAAS
jgi:hypothetical protein